MSSDDQNPRPSKRQRVSDLLEPTVKEEEKLELKPLPHPTLLVSLPDLLVHPPNHRYHAQSLCLSLASIRKCLAMESLNVDVECRAWTALAEVGLIAIEGGFSQNEDYPWAEDIEDEIEKGIAKGLLIAQKHPSLRPYKHHLGLLHARLAQWQQKRKFARNIIRRCSSAFNPSDPPRAVYTAQLASIAGFLAPKSHSGNKRKFGSDLGSSSSLPSSSSPFSTPSKSRVTTFASSPSCSARDLQSALSAIQDLQNLAMKNRHPQVVLLSQILRLRTLVQADAWDSFGDALKAAEDALGLVYDPAASTPVARRRSAGANQPPPAPPPPPMKKFEDAFESTMAVHALLMGITYLTHVGESAEGSVRLAHLHELLDGGALDRFPDGIVEIPFETGPPLSVQVTHPRVLYFLAFLVSSTSRRDAIGRKPKRKVFASEGLASWEREVKKELTFPRWAALDEVWEVEQRLATIKADLYCELVAVSTMRSEFDGAEQNLASLIAHARTFDIFDRFSARIALHNAHLAHARGHHERAEECYRAAAHLAERDGDAFVEAAARAGEVTLRIGLVRVKGLGEDEEERVRKRAVAVAERCQGMGRTLEAVGLVIEACLTKEIVKSKALLKQALGMASKAQDNHLRALVLAMVAAHYMHTAGDHAQAMLETCEQIAAGLGATVGNEKGKLTPGGKGLGQGIGNAPLRLWIGERFVELYKRAGKEKEARRREAANGQVARVVEQMGRRPLGDSGQERV